VGGEAARAIQAAVRGAHQTDAGLTATLLSVIPLLIGASSVVVELHDALNTIWDVKEPDPGSLLNSILHFIKQRLYLTLVVIAAGCLLLISLLLSIFIATVGRFFTALLPTPEWVLHLAAFAASFIVVTLLFGAIYKLLPDIRLRWSDVFIGASVTSLLFTIGKQVIAVYLGRVGFESTYGAVWAAVILLIWVYYSAQMFFLGAEFTKVYARSFGSHIKVPATPARGETNKFS
jgi:membrane protein